MTIITVLHDINLALEFCDEAVVMKEGRITAHGDIDKSVDEAVLNDAFNINSEIAVKNGKKYCLFRRKGEAHGK